MPFFNIFSNSKTKKPKIKPKIIADIHEKNSLIISELHHNKEIELELKPLKIGDYLVGKTIIERKTIRDFISSILNKRLIQQLNQMQQYKQQLLIIEGYNEQDIYEKINPNAIRGMLLSISLNSKIPIIFTQDYEDTSKFLITLAKQQLKPQTQFTLHSRIPKTLEEQKSYVLESFPNIGPQTAQKLLQEFKSIKNIINAPQKELEEIIGKKAEIFRKIIE